MSETRLQCEVFTGSRRPGTYLYVARDEAFSRVPAALLAGLGETRSVLSLELYPGRPLAQVRAEAVLEAIATAGFYLQLPPGEARYDDAATDAAGDSADAC